MREVKALKHQAQFMTADQRYVALIGGFGCGKSYGIGLKLWNLARINAGFDGMLVSRTSTQLRKLCGEVETVFNLMGTSYVKKGFDEYHLKFGNKTSVVYLGTTENYAYRKWAGGNLAFVVIDEIDTMPHAEDVWRFANDRVRVKAPLLQTACASTPEGYGFCWKFWEDDVIKDPTLAPTRAIIRGCTFDNPYIDADYVRSQIQTRDPRTLKAYVYGEFINLDGLLVYYRYNKEANNTNLTLAEPRFHNLPIHVGLDFNKGINAATLSVVQDGIVYALDEIYGMTDTDRLIAELNRRIGNRLFYIYPDASGFEGIQQLKRAYGSERVLHPNKNPQVERRVTAVNDCLATPTGMVRTYVNQTKCPHLHNGLLRQTKDAQGQPDKTKGLDHSLDGFGYFVHYRFPPTTSNGPIRLSGY